ncbi:MAG: PASTA domain-containing protein, partial [Candidatus Eisenbacteria bacterium]|nr:PASTA domain-containing protein [Candidatus Eisenbacteria bacterium]
GPERFYRMMRHMGFGLSTGVGFPGEARGRVLPPEEWNRRSLPTMGFGHELSVSAIQLAMAYAAVANGGLLLKPLLVREVRDARGRVVERSEPRVVRRVMQEETSRKLARIFRLVVERGTGAAAEIPWYPPAGKTGTGQVYDPQTGTYSNRDYIASFVGFAPWHAPRYLCLVVIDSPQGSIYGGQTAGPIFRSILEDLSAACGGPPRVAVAGRDSLHRPRALPDVRGLAPDEARRVLKADGFVPVLEGRGLRVREMDPPAGTVGSPGTVVHLLPGGPDPASEAVMPDLSGWPLRRALVELSRQGWAWRAQGDGWVIEQSPPPGARVTSSTTCRLTASHGASDAWSRWIETWEDAADATVWGHAEARP